MNFLKKSFLFKSFLFSLFLFFLLSGSSLAGAKLEIGLPGAPSEMNNPAEYLRYIFIFSYSFIGFLAVAMIVYGGILYSIPGKTGKAKEMILGALSGVALLFCSYLILWLIDPTLVQLTPNSPEPVSVSAPEEYVTPPNVLSENAKNIQAYNSESLLTAKLFCKDGLANQYVCEDLQGTNGKLSQTLINNLKNLPVSVVITETTGSHGCSPADSCVEGASCGTSDHCKGTAVDISIRNQTPANIEKILESLHNSSCVSDLFYAGLPEYCLNDGGVARTNAGSACLQHTTHIHYSVMTLCK